jgi:thymidylate kinase
MKFNSKTICITGIDGSGKTTLIERLGELIEGSRVVTIWDLMKVPEITRYYNLRSSQEVEDYLAQLHYPARTYFLFQCLSEALYRSQESNPKVTLIDAYWYKYAAGEIALGGDPAEITRMAAPFPKPDHIFIMDVSADTARQRKQSLTAYEDGLEQFENFEAFQAQSSQVLRQLLKDENPIILDAEKPLEENAQRIIEIVNQPTRNRPRGP